MMHWFQWGLVIGIALVCIACVIVCMECVEGEVAACHICWCVVCGRFTSMQQGYNNI